MDNFVRFQSEWTILDLLISDHWTERDNLINLKIVRDVLCNLTNSIRKKRLSRGLICTRFDNLTLLNLPNYHNDAQKWPTWSCFDNLTESSDLIGWLCQIIETGSRGSFLLVVSIIWQIQKCQNIETNAYQPTWQSPLSNEFCQIPLIAP